MRLSPSGSPSHRRPPRAVPALAAILAALSLPAATSAQEQPTLPTLPPHFAITNARIVPVSGPVLENGTVVVRDGVIQAVGRNVRVPADAWVLDGSGLAVYPGLIDPMGTLGHPAPRGGARAGGPAGGGQGGGASSDAEHSWGPEDRPGTFTWLSAADDLDGGDDRIADWRDAGYTTALSTLPRGNVTGSAALINLAGDRGREMVVTPLPLQRVNLDAYREFPGYPASLLGAFAYLKQLHYDADHYDAAWSAYERDPRGRTRPEYDRALEPLRAPVPLLFPAEGRKEILRALETSRAMGSPVIVYGAQQGYEAVDVLKAGGVPVLVDMDWPRPPRNADPADEPTLAQLRAYEHAPTTPARLAEAGVLFAFWTGGLDDPSDARARVKRAVDAGLPAEAALRALTLDPAGILGVSDRVGSIEAGKIANLVLVRGDLLDPDAPIEQVIVDGRRFPVFHPSAVASRSDRDGMRRERREGGEPGEAPDGREEGEARQGRVDASPAPSGPVVPMVRDRGPYRSDAVTLIRNATVMTVANGTVEGGDVLIRDGKIAAVGRGLDAPRGARVVDATGLTVMPGIIDAHSHLAADAINEGSVNSSAMVRIRDVLDPEDVGMYRALAGGVTTINVLHGSANPIGGQNAVLKLRWGADAADLLFEDAPPGIKFALGENVKRDRDPDRYPSTRMGQQDVIRQAFLDAQAYQREWEAYNALSARARRNTTPPRRDLEMEALAEILRGERLVHAHSYRGDEILQLLRTAEEFGVTIATLQHVLEGYKVADEIAAHGAGASTFSDWWAYKMEAYDAIPHNAALMAERGVLVSINSDSGEEIRHLNQEAAKTIKWGGASPEEAIRFITANPARQLGVADQVGTIEVGRDADLAVFEGDPLSVTSRVRQTYVDGHLYFDVDLDGERRAAIEREKAALLEKHRGTRPATTPVTDGVVTPSVTPSNDTNEEVRP
ncbi:MAG: amidohydrolase family protein [Gemmatimonadetes bacterium]|nr:amidohydrolase family protein [Gemmatimonadota bacterium]